MIFEYFLWFCVRKTKDISSLKLPLKEHMTSKLPKRSGQSRKIAFQHYQPICVWCGVSISDLLEVAHLDHDRSNDEIKNLVFLCLTHHRMLDLGLIPSDVVIYLRDKPLKADWSILIKGGKSKTRPKISLRQKRSLVIPKILESRDAPPQLQISKIQTESEIEKITIKRREAALKAWATRRALNPKKFGELTIQDKILLEKIKTEKNKTKNKSNDFKIIRSLAAYKAHLTRRQQNPKKYGNVTNDLMENIKRLEKLKTQ